MNTQIENLAKQCWSHRVDGTLVDGQLHFDYRKFAELIVQECADVAKETRWAVPPSQEQIARGIRQHFGVEE